VTSRLEVSTTNRSCNIQTQSQVNFIIIQHNNRISDAKTDFKL